MNTTAHSLPFAAGYGSPRSRPRGAFPWVPAFIVFQLLCQVTLIVGDIGWGRMVVRMAAFGASLALVLALRGRGSAHPAGGVAVLALAVLGICVFHPETRSLVGGVAQVGLYAAVLGPLFWVPRLTSIDMRMLRRAVMILWGFHALSAALGVLQVYRPGTFQPPISAVVESKGKGYVESLKITTATGARVFRPMGLTDVPGGAAISGLYAVLLGVGFFLTRRTPGVMAASLASIGLGVACLYLSQVRALVVMTGISLIAIAGILIWRRDVRRFSTLVLGVALMMGLGFVAARGMAGPDVTRRMGTLVRASPSKVYYDNRGRFLEDAIFKTLPNAPFGEGLGHWGMTATYFGSGTPTKNVWVEIMWAGWIVDGGAPLLLTYLLTLGITLWAAWRIARSKPPSAEAADLPFWGAIVLAYSVGATALTFSYPIFLSQSGMEFWLLNATLFAAARHAHQQAAAGRLSPRAVMATRPDAVAITAGDAVTGIPRVPRPWVIVAGDFVRTGGMDAANHALASFLARGGRETHLVAHRVADDLAALPNLHVHRVPRPLRSHTLGFPLLDRAGRRAARELADRGPVVLANGGNCRAANVTWLHYVHAAYAPEIAGRPLRRLAAAGARRAALRDERAVVLAARAVLCNSERTARHARERIGRRGGLHPVYYGADADRFRPPAEAERGEARRALGWEDGRPALVFVGALGDRRKGFDTLFDAWTRLCAEAGWDARLAVVGAGGELDAWRRRAAEAGLADRIVFLGFQADVRRVLWAADALVSPTRYEAYGLAVQEALCCGLPAIVSAEAGVAERIPPSMRDLLVPDPDDAEDLARRLRGWRGSIDIHRAAALDLSRTLRAWTWDDMARQIVGTVEDALRDARMSAASAVDAAVAS